VSEKITSFKDLVAWQKAHELVLKTYKVLDGFPASEKFALSDQMKRAAVSITSNIAEGFSRKTARDKAQFYQTALGSLTELESQIMVAFDLHYLDKNICDDLDLLITETSRLLNGLIKATRASKFVVPHS
jgi:four helix bundle protein